MSVENTAISDGFVQMYDIACTILKAPPGALTDWEENLLCNFIEMYWAEGELKLEHIDA